MMDRCVEVVDGWMGGWMDDEETDGLWVDGWILIR